MKNIFKVLVFTVFTVFFLQIPNASANDFLYARNDADVTAGGDLTECHVSLVNGTYNNCHRLNPALYGFIGNITDITVSPNGSFAYVGIWPNIIYVCVIKDDTGFFGHCGTPNQITQSSRNIGMSLNGTGDKLYVLYEDGQQKDKVAICPSNNFYCTIVNYSFTNATSIAISADNKYAYVTLPDKASVYICPILADGTFNSCTANTEKGVITKPSSIAINPNPANSKGAYIVNSEISNPTILYCPFNKAGASFGNCTSSKLQGPGIDEDNIPLGIALSSNGKYVYISSNNKPYLIKCTVTDNGLSKCVGDRQGLAFNNPSALAYRTGN